jgi:hypothetical protein
MLYERFLLSTATVVSQLQYILYYVYEYEYSPSFNLVQVSLSRDYLRISSMSVRFRTPIASIFLDGIQYWILLQ